LLGIFGAPVLGGCMKMLNTNFPWIPIVKARPRHPQSQRLIERSHVLYKRALVQAMADANTSNELVQLYVVKCTINNHATPNRSSYSAMFGKVYKVGKTEFGH